MFRSILKLFPTLPALAVLVTSTALPLPAHADGSDFIYRYKLSAVVDGGTGNPGTGDPGTGGPGDGDPDTGTPGGDPDNGTPDEDPGDGEPVECIDDPECSTDHNGETRYVDPIIAPLRTVLYGGFVEDDRWFARNWQDNVYSDVDEWVPTRLTIKDMSLPMGLGPSGFDVGGPYQYLYGGIEGIAGESGPGQIVYNVEADEDDDGVYEKVSELVVRVNVVGIPENIVAPTRNVLVGDTIGGMAKTWFQKNYGSAIGPGKPFYSMEIESSTYPVGTTVDVESGDYKGTVGEAGSFSARIAIYGASPDPETGTFVPGPKVATLHLSLNASPNIYQAALVTVPTADSGSEVTHLGYTIWDPGSDLIPDLVQRYEGTGEPLVAGASILGLHSSSCPGGVTWFLDGEGMEGLPPDMNLKKVDDGMALLEYNLADTPDGNGYSASDLPYEYDYVRAVGVCRDGNGDPMVTYRSTAFTILVQQPL